jgi:hypothetical protein
LTTGLEALREEKSSGKGSPSKRKMLQKKLAGEGGLKT